MKKRVFGRKLKRDANERKALFKNLLTSLVLSERIKTTEAKAKAIKAAADKLVTKAKKAHSVGSVQGGDRAAKLLHPDVNQPAVTKLISDIAPRFAKRAGGYTRIIKIGKGRVADNARMVFLEWTEAPAGANLGIGTSSFPKASTGAKAMADKSAGKKNLKQGKKVKKAEKAKKRTVAPQVEPKREQAKPIVKEEKVKKQGFLKQLVTRQKKG